MTLLLDDVSSTIHLTTTGLESSFSDQLLHPKHTKHTTLLLVIPSTTTLSDCATITAYSLLH